MEKLSEKHTFLISLILGFIFLAVFPYIVWLLKPTQPLQVWILDNTVPTKDYREHKGLMWVLNHFKMNNELAGREFQYDTDYYGFFPVSKDNYHIRQLPMGDVSPDLIYIADTYGVYQEDYFADNLKGDRSSLIYGGLSETDLLKIEKKLRKYMTLIAEFNSLASPTSTDVRGRLEGLTGISWSGWIGRYFVDLTQGKEVPEWLVINYEKQYGEKWEFRGPGIAFVSEDDQVMILLQGLDIGSGGIAFSLEKSFEQEFSVQEPIPYYYWFEFVQPEKNTETIASYHLDVTESGLSKLKQIGLETTFPAIVRKKTDDFTSYYFASDFADNNKVPQWWQYWGIDIWKKWTTLDIKGQTDFFYWHGYVPIMKKILADIKLQQAQVGKTQY